jgi:hypothetical protein
MKELLRLTEKRTERVFSFQSAHGALCYIAVTCGTRETKS